MAQAAEPDAPSPPGAVDADTTRHDAAAHLWRLLFLTPLPTGIALACIPEDSVDQTWQLCCAGWAVLLPSALVTWSLWGLLAPELGAARFWRAQRDLALSVFTSSVVVLALLPPMPGALPLGLRLLVIAPVLAMCSRAFVELDYLLRLTRRLVAPSTPRPHPSDPPTARGLLTRVWWGLPIIGIVLVHPYLVALSRVAVLGWVLVGCVMLGRALWLWLQVGWYGFGSLLSRPLTARRRQPGSNLGLVAVWVVAQMPGLGLMAVQWAYTAMEQRQFERWRHGDQTYGAEELN